MARKAESDDQGDKVVGQLVGEEKDVPLKSLKPNKWNPNHMTPEQKASLRYGLETDGWLRSQKLLVWGSDENGEVKNIIIDGEHRWREAKAMGIFDNVPAVFLHGITESAAKKLTVKIGKKRGEFNPAELSDLIREVYDGIDTATYALDLGFETPDIDKMLKDLEPQVNTDAADTAADPLKPSDKLVDVAPFTRTLPATGLKGVQPNVRIPLVFYADNEEMANEVRNTFAHPKREFELNGGLLLKVARYMLVEHKEKLDEMRKEAFREEKAAK